MKSDGYSNEASAFLLLVLMLLLLNFKHLDPVIRGVNDTFQLANLRQVILIDDTIDIGIREA